MNPVGPFAARHGGAQISVMSGLVGWWSLNEASGTRLDSHTSALSLTNNNTVTQAAGIRGNAAQFTAANTESLSRADEAAFRTEDFTIAYWVYLDAKAAAYQCATRYRTDTDQRHWRLVYGSGPDRFQFTVSSDGSAANETIFNLNSLGSPSTATWYFLVASHDSTADRVRVSANAGTVDETAYASGVFETSTADFTLGAQHAGGGAPHDGRLDEVALWSRELTAREIRWLYNGGAGRSYPPKGKA